MPSTSGLLLQGGGQGSIATAESSGGDSKGREAVGSGGLGSVGEARLSQAEKIAEQGVIAPLVVMLSGRQGGAAQEDGAYLL